MANETVTATVSQSNVSSPVTVTRSPAYRAYLRSLKRRAYAVQACQIGLLAAVLILWEVAPRAGWINPMLTSYPSAVARTFMTMLEAASWCTFR